MIEAAAQPRVLLTSVIRPFGGPGEGDSVGAELFHAQVTRAQGAFSLRQVIRVWALDYLAENIEAPTVVLHYPSRRQLVKELKSGSYTHVGINFVVATFHKVREMVELVRRHSPKTKVILGGYGTVLPDIVLTPYADAICREEGVGFMRKLLDEPLDRPLRHPHAPIPSVQVVGARSPNVVGHVTAGLGCPNGCDFCCTSHFFKRKYERFAGTGRDIYEALMATRACSAADGQPMKSFILIDEDFFLHHKRARQFLDCVREGGEALSIMGFGSVRGLSKFTATEIAEMGFTLVWNAFEGTSAGYGKQKGKPIDELYRDLKSVGCGQLTSMIIGFPYQDEAQMRREFSQLMALEPAMVQCLIYFAFPGTPFHEQVISEGRYLDEFKRSPDLRRWDGFAMHFEHPKIKDPKTVERIQREFYREDFRRLGPTPLRLARVWLTGYENLRNDPNPILRARAEMLRLEARKVLPLLRTSSVLGPSREARGLARRLRRDIIRLTGTQSRVERVKEMLAPAMYASSRLARLTNVFQQPALLRTEHRTALEQSSRDTKRVHTLQGAPYSSVRTALADEIVDRFDRLATRIRGERVYMPPEVVEVTNRATGMPVSLPVVADSPPACFAVGAG
jgi:haloalkane dehalogenase